MTSEKFKKSYSIFVFIYAYFKQIFIYMLCQALKEEKKKEVKHNNDRNLNFIFCNKNCSRALIAENMLINV